MRCFVFFFIFNVGSLFKILDIVVRDTLVSIAMFFSVVMFIFFIFFDVRFYCRGSVYRVICF